MASHLKLEVIKCSGQSRITLSNPLKHSGFVPVKGTEIFVQGFPMFVNKNWLIEKMAGYFCQAGEILEIRLMMYDDMVKNRGFAFVSYVSVEAANKAIEELAKTMFIGRKLEMNISVSNRKLFIGGIPEFMTQEDILRELKNQGMRGIVEVSFSKNPEFHTKLNRGYAFVEFTTHHWTAEVKSAFYGNLKLGGRNVSLEWSKTGERIDEEDTVIHVGNLMWEQTIEELKEIVLQFACQESIKSMRKVRSFAFIHVVDGTTAEELMAKLKGYYKDTRVEVNWGRISRRYDSQRELKMIHSDVRNYASSPGTQISLRNRNVRTDSGSSTGDSVTGTEQILREGAIPATPRIFEETPDGCQFCENHREWDHNAFLAKFHQTCRELENTKSPDAQQKLFYSYMLEHRGYHRFLPYLIHLCLESNYSYCFVDEYAPGEYNVYLFEFMRVMGMLLVGS